MITTSALPLARIYSVHPVCYHLPAHRHITSLVTRCLCTNSGPAYTRTRATLYGIRTHSLDSVAEVIAAAASATGSNVVGIIGCEACLSVPNVEMKVQWSFSFSQLSSHIPFHSTDRLDKRDTPPIPKVYKFFPGVKRFVSISDPSHGTRFPSTAPSQSRRCPQDRRSPCMFRGCPASRQCPNLSLPMWA